MDIKEESELKQECLNAQLEGMSAVSKYTDEELCKICNGIGAEWMPEKLRKLCDKLLPHMRPPAFIHDVDYYIGGGMAEFDAANERFRRNIKKYAKYELRWYEFWKYPFIARTADKATELLREFGQKAFNFTEKEDTAK